MKRLLLPTILSLVFLPALGQSRGKFSIGFRSFMLYDLSRPPISEQLDFNQNQKGRVVQTNLWYPAVPSGSKKMLFNDYLKLKSLEIDSTLPVEKQELSAKTILAQNYNTTIDTISGLTHGKYEFSAIRNALFLSQKFPLAVILHNDPVGFASIAEHLASHGFVVANFPVTGTASKKFDWQTIAGIQTELNDLDFVVDAVSNMPIVDASQIIPIGYSYGAMAALAYQLKNKNVKGVISLDGGIGSLWGGELVFKVPDFHIGELNRPIFHAWSDLGNPYSDHRWLENYICADKYIMKFGKLRHGDFVEGVLFEKLQPGITLKALGKKVDGNEVEFQKLIESVVSFCLWITTQNKTYEAQLNASTLPYTKIKGWGCKKM